IMMMLLGTISSRSSSSTRCRRQRLRRAMATAFLAASCPTMYLSSSATTWRGVSSSLHPSAAALSSGGGPSVAAGSVGDRGSAVCIFVIGCACCFECGSSLERQIAGAGGSRVAQLQHGDVQVGVDADLPGDLQPAPDDVG